MMKQEIQRAERLRPWITHLDPDLRVRVEELINRVTAGEETSLSWTVTAAMNAIENAVYQAAEIVVHSKAPEDMQSDHELSALFDELEQHICNIFTLFIQENSHD